MARAGFMFCMCPDSVLLRNEIAAQLAADASTSLAGSTVCSGGDSKDTGWTRSVFWGDEELPPAFWEALTLQGLFAVPQALIVRNAHNLTAEVWRRLNTALASAGKLTWPFLCLEGGWEKGQAKIPAHIKKLRCFEHAEKQGWIWRQAPLDSAGIRRHIRSHAQHIGLHFASGALEQLATALPPDAAVIENELDRLSLLAGDEPLSAAHAASVEHAPPFDMFAFLRQIQAGNAVEVWKTVLREHRQSDELVFPLLALLQREARLLWQLRAGESPYLHPASAEAKRATATRLGFTGLARLWDAMHTAEYAVKSGSRTPSQALDALLGDLTRIFAPAAPKRSAPQRTGIRPS